ncbi:MAG: D-amino-acid transaminase [Hyphomicrobiaceae bacterium]
MSRWVYVNGRYCPYGEAFVHAEDRGFQFADAVYEVIEVRSGKLVDLTRHLARLSRSLGEIAMGMPMSPEALTRVIRETVRRNRVTEGSVYLQVSRGARPRDFLFPAADSVRQTVVCIARSSPRAVADGRAARGIAVVTLPESRWSRCDIKTVMLLPAVLAKEAARASGAQEAWFVDAGGFVTEGASSNAWIIDREGRLLTRPVDRTILRGVTRTTLLDVLASERLELVERAFTVSEARNAREAFVTAATNVVTPVVRIDGKDIGDGQPGPVARRLRARFHDLAENAG